MYETGRGAGRGLAKMTAVAGLAALLGQGVVASAQCLPGRCGFTESGKQGRFIATRVSADDLAKNDASIASGGSSESLLAAQSVNRGQFFGTGLSMPESERMLEAMIADMSKQWSLRSIGPLRVRIVGTNSFVPQSFADNVIMVPFGVLARAKSDGQVAWLMGHEYSHLLLAHFARTARSKKRSKSIGGVVAAIDTATSLAQVRVDTSGGKLRTYEVTDKDTVALGDALVARTDQLKLLLSLSESFFSRSDEDRADVLGVDLAFGAHSPYGAALDALEIIQNDEVARAGMFDQIAGKTAEYGQKTGMATLAAATHGADVGNALGNWVKDLGANARVVAFKSVKESYLEQHRPTDKRIEGIRKYSQKAYAGVPDLPPSRRFLTAVRATREYAEAEIAVNATTMAMDRLVANDPAGAKAALMPALATRYGATPLVSNLLAKVAWRQGDLHGADAAYTKAEHLVAAPAIRRPAAPARSPRGRRTLAAPGSSAVAAAPTQALREPYLEQSLDGFQDHVSLLIHMRSYPKAFSVIAEAKARFHDDTAFLPSYVALYFATNQPTLAIDALNRCINAADPVIEQQCRAGMLRENQQAKVDAMSPVDQAKVAAVLSRTQSKAQSSGWLAQIGSMLKPDDN